MNARDRVVLRDPRLPLSVVIARFDRIADEVVPLSPQAAAALPESPVTWRRLADLLVDTSVSFEVMDVDAVWAWLIVWARREGDEAVLVCAGLAVPMLAATAARLAIRIDGERADAEAAVLAAFADAIVRVDPLTPHLWCALRWAAYRGGRRWEKAEAITSVPIPSQESGVPHPNPERGLEALLALAVAEGAIDAKAAALIADTRLSGRSLISFATEHGKPYRRLNERRKRAEEKLGRWLRERIGEAESGCTSIVEASAIDATAFIRPAQKPILRAPRIFGPSDASTGCARPSGVCARPTLPEVKRCA